MDEYKTTDEDFQKEHKLEEKNFGNFDEEEKSRRKFIARILEVSSTIPLIGIVANNFSKDRVYYQLDYSEAELDEKPDIVKKMQLVQQEFNESLEALCSSYSVYKKSKIVPYTTVVDGKVRTRFRTEHYWDEEKAVPDHNIVYAWKKDSSDLLDKINKIESEKLVDISK